MSLIQDKLGSEFLRPSGGMDGAGGGGGFGSGMLMFSHLPPVTSFTRLAAQSVMADLPPPQEILSLKKERESPDCSMAGSGLGSGLGSSLGGGLSSGLGGGLGGLMGGVGDYMHTMGIKQEKFPEHDYRLPLYPGGGGIVDSSGVGALGNHNGVMGQRNGSDLLEVSLGNHQNLLVHDLSLNNQLSGRLNKESTGRKSRKTNADGTEGKPRRKRGEAKALMLDPDGECLSPNSKPHICEHCNAAFRSSYHLRRHVLIHTGERPFRCSQCNMSFIQKYLLQRHEKIHSGEKPFSCDQCNMRFIQKYHMERHKRTHSGEKPYKCDTCQQYFSRTDRLLKHKRTCGEAIRKGVDGGLLAAGAGLANDDGQGSYSLTQGNGPAPTGRKRAKGKNGEGGERKRRKQAGGGGGGVGPPMGAQDGGYSLQGQGNYTLDKQGAVVVHAGPSIPNLEPGRGPKMAFKKGGRSKGLEKAAEDKQGGVDGLGLVQAPTGKTTSTSSNYDDAMQFLKKRRYLPAPTTNGVSGGGTSTVSTVGGSGSVDYDVGVGHLGVQGTVGGVLDTDGPLSGLLDPSPLSMDLKHDIKSAITDEVLQSLLDHYTHKPDVTFDLSEPHSTHHHHSQQHHHHVDLQPPSALGPEDDAPSPGSGIGGDKTVMMHEYSRFLLQALERTSGHHLGFLPPSSSPSSTGPFAGGPLYSSDKHVVYGSSPLECGGSGGFSQPTVSTVSSPAASSPSLSTTSSVPKSHFSLLSGSPPPPSQHAFHLGGLESVMTQQLTPSQELTEQLDKPLSSTTSSSSSPHAQHTAPHTPSASTPSASASSAKNSVVGGTFPLTPSQELNSLDTAKSASPYQIENFAQAFGSQFKAASGGGGNSGGSGSSNGTSGAGRGVSLQFSTDSGGDRTPVSDFSGYSSLLADVGDPVSNGSKTPTSQSYR